MSTDDNDFQSLRDEIAAAKAFDDECRRICGERQSRRPEIVCKSNDGCGLIYKTHENPPPMPAHEADGGEHDSDAALFESIVEAIELRDAWVGEQAKRVSVLEAEVKALRKKLKSPRGRDVA
jgi:hypothetical protein